MGKAARNFLAALKLRTVGSKIAAVCFFNCLLLAVVILLVFSKISYDTYEDAITQVLVSDVAHLQDLLSLNEEPDWRIEDGFLWCNDKRLGDGTVENALTDPFKDLQQKSGSFSYTFMRIGDDNLTWVGDKKTGYMQGHYMRVAGSTLDNDGNSIIGTCMDKEVADIVDESGFYVGEANVVGSHIFCVYKVVKNSDGEIVGCIVAGKAVSEIKNSSRITSSIVLIIITLSIIASLGIIGISRRWTNAVSDIDDYLKQIGTGVFPEEPLVLKSDDEIGDIADSVNEMLKSIKEKDRIGAELKLASDLQQGLLPRIFPPFPEYDSFDIYATMTPAREIGGDFYDMFLVDDTHVAFLVGDVSGKGVPAAIIMAVAKVFIRNLCKGGSKPSEVFRKFNSVFAEDNTASYFITSWLGILDITNGKLEFCNAGHNPPLLTTGADGKFEYLKQRSGLVLGAMPNVRYKLGETELKPGDRIFLYTDGVTEANNSKHELYGEDRLKEYLDGTISKNFSVKDTLEGLKEDIDIFTENEEQFDDITMLIFDYKKYVEDINDGFIVSNFPAKLDKLNDVLGFVEDEVTKAGCPPKTMMQITLSLEEVFVNVASYAYPNPDEPGEVTVAVKADEDKAIIRLTDSGIPFDPLKKADPDLTLSAEERGIGGLGIFLTKKQMDKVDYERKNDKNILTMEKSY